MLEMVGRPHLAMVISISSRSKLSTRTTPSSPPTARPPEQRSADNLSSCSEGDRFHNVGADFGAQFYILPCHDVLGDYRQAARCFDPLEILPSGRRIRTGTAAGGMRRLWPPQGVINTGNSTRFPNTVVDKSSLLTSRSTRGPNAHDAYARWLRSTLIHR